MTRTMIAGRASGASSNAGAAEKQAKSLKAAASPTADAGEDDALAEQFTREFNAVLRQVKETQRGSGDVDTPFSAGKDPQTERTSVAHYGAISQRLLLLVRRLLFRTDELAVSKKARLLLSFGDKFAAAFEYVAADRYFYQQVLGFWRRNSEMSKSEVYVQAAYGAALCQFQVVKREDAFARFPGTLEKLLVALQVLQHGMEVAVELERASPHQYAWLLLNGSVLVYSIAHPLQILGFEREVVAYLKWCLLCLESTVMLSTTKYILWRLQIYSDVCACLERMASNSPKKTATYLKAALECAEHALQAVQRLRKEEELDLPLPTQVIATLGEADTIVGMLVLRLRSLAKGEFLGRKAIEATADARDRLRLIVDALEKSFDLLVDNPSVVELFALAMETAAPMIQSDDAAGSDTVDKNALLLLPFHLMLLRHAYRLQRLQDARTLLEVAKNRVAALGSAQALSMEMQIYDALVELDKPQADEETTEEISTKPSRVELILAVARAVKSFVRKTRDAFTTPVRDFLQAVALRVWYEGAIKVVQELETLPKPSDGQTDRHLVINSITLIETVYTTLRKVEFEDLVLLGEVCMRLCLLLHVRKDRRKAIRVLRDYLTLVNKHRDTIANASNHFISRRDASSRAIAYATFSFDVEATHASSDCQASETSLKSSRQHVGVEGTGSQFGGLHQELVCIQADSLLLLFQLELEESNVLDAIDASVAPPGSNERVSRRPTAVAVTEAALVKEYKKNAYARVLLNVRRMRQQPPTRSPEQMLELTTECFTLLRQVEAQERDLFKNVADLGHQPAAETATPRAPRIVMRSSSAIAVEIIPFQPATAAARRRAIAYYMVFAKSSGAGTAVSLNNSEYPGTGEPIYTPELQVTVSGLASNTSYVFAVAAFDEQGDVIEGIGATTKPVVAVNPLPLAACYGYLAQACFEQKLMEPARQAAMRVYDYVVSKDCGDRPGWAANFFYRHSLKRDVVARWPIPLLNLAVQSILVICDEEIGDAFCDGQLISTGNILRPKQIAVVEASKMIAIALEIACAAADHEQIRVLCFKGYRILLPLLHLDDVNAITFAALATYYQALWCIPRASWDTDTRSIAARTAFELMKIAWRHRHVMSTLYEQITKLKALESGSGNRSPADVIPSNELSALLDSIALAECAIGQPLDALTPGSRPATAVMTHQVPGKTAPPTAIATKAATDKSAATPQPTAREERDGELPRLRDLVAQSKLSLRDAFSLLEPFMKAHRDSLEVFCKICQSAIALGDEAAIDEWLPQIKISGRFGAEFKGVLKSVALEHLLPEPAPAIPAQPTPSAPTTARSAAKTPRGPDPVVVADVSLSPRVPIVEPQCGEDDEYLYMWCGELCLLQSKILMRKIAQHRSQHDDVDVSRGPTYDYASLILKEGGSAAVSTVHPHENPQESDLSTSRTRDENVDAPSSSRSENQPVGELLHQFLTRAAAACRMFVLAKAWQSLQTAVQHVAKAIWLVWASPDDFAKGGQLAICLDTLTACVDAILDMIEYVTYAIKDEQSGRVATTVSPTAEDSQATTANSIRNATLSLASTTVVVSAMSSVNADQTWISNLLEFVVQALLAAQQWHKLVLVGKKYHLLSGGGSRFSERMVSVLVFAQQQYLAEQTALLESAEASLASFVKAFQDAEAKKKKKKSRLVVEEVLTPEEIEFRGKKEVMEHEIHALVQERNTRQHELDTIQQMHDAVTQSTNKCTQALDSCHDLVEKHRRHGDSVVKIQQVVNAFTHCVALARQKRQRRVAGKALQELGDFLWDRGEVKAAVKAWNEAIDNAFNALHSTTCWRDILGSNGDEDKEQSSDAWIEGEGLWICLESCIAIKKLILHDSPTANASKVELARMAAAAMTRIVARCSLPLPTRGFLYGSFQAFGQLWPGRELLADTERLDATRFGAVFVVVIQTLLQYDQPAEAMPLILGYEYLARQIFEDTNHVANALCFRLEALTQCGRFHDAFETLASLLVGVSIDGRDAKPTKVDALVAKLQFRDEKPLAATANSNVVAWLTAFDSAQVHAELLTSEYKPETARMVLVSTLKLIVALTLREPIQEEAASTVRQVANKAAAALGNMFSLSAHELEAETGKSAWETLELIHARAEVLLSHSMVAIGGGQWTTAQELAAQVIQQVAVSRKIIDASPTPHSQLSLDHRVPTLLVLKPSTLSVRARLISVRCDLAKGAYKTAIEQVSLAVKEARSHGEPTHFVLQLELLRVQALVFLGSSTSASRELFALQDAFVKSHSQESPAFVELLRMRATLLRHEAMESNDTSAKLVQVLTLLGQAEASLDRVLRRDGWVGVEVDAANETRLGLYHPCIPAFVHLKVEIAQALMETPMSDANQRLQNRQRALLALDIALRAIDHSIKSLTPLKAKLHFLHGSILKTMLMKSEPMASIEETFTRCTSALTSSVEEAIRVETGGHDRELLCSALLELVDLYGAKLLAGQESEHLQSAFHYLNLALTVRAFHQTLFNSLELQSGSLTNPEKLPMFVVSAILSQQPTVTPPPVEPAKAAPTGKGAAPQPAVTDAGKKAAGVDAQRVVNYFVKILREKEVLPACTALQQDVAVLLHAFLVQNHSSYAKMCCLPSLPPVPHDDPEIKAGLICAHWKRELAPAFSENSSTLSLFFTLGTTCIDMGTESTANDNQEAIQQRAELFATAPLLSKRTGIVETDVVPIRERLSNLRVQMEDEDSLVTDRSAFSSAFGGILREIQRLFHVVKPNSKAKTTRQKDGDDSGPSEDADTKSTELVHDSFGIVIPVACTLDTVRLLEGFLHPERGANNAVDSTLCYFLRDVLDN